MRVRAGRRRFCWGLAVALLAACGESATPGRLSELSSPTAAPVPPTATGAGTAPPATPTAAPTPPATATTPATATAAPPATAPPPTATALPTIAPPTAAPPTAVPPTATPPTAVPATAAAEIERLIAGMSLEEQVGQVIVGQLPGPALDGETAAMLRDLRLGAMVLFGYNTGTADGMRALTAAIQAACGRPGLPAIVAADQEGGAVNRLPPGATIFPGAMAIGATNSADHARRFGLATARELRAVGINTDFAPVLDVNNNPQNPVIGLRSYGERPDDVARLGAAAVAGLLEGGVLATGKHFPGHGDTTVDSHVGLPVNPNSLARLRAVELPPFQAAIAAGVPLIMTAHIIFRALDPDLPSTLSRAVLTGLLREQLGFQGVIVSDAMSMQAIAAGWGTVDGAARFIAAGGDLVLPLRDERAVHAAIVAAVRSGRIPIAQLVASVRRVLAARLRLGAQGAANPSWLGAQEHRDLAATIARDAITVVRDAGRLIPLPRASRLAVIEATYTARTSALAEALRPRFGAVAGLVVSAEQPTAAEVAAAQGAAAGADVVVYGTRGAADYPAQARLAATLAATGKPVVAVALAEPYDAGAYPALGTALATYGNEAALLSVLAAVLAGEVVPTGRLPVTV